MALFADMHARLDALRHEALEGLRPRHKVADDVRAILYEGADLVEEAQAVLEHVRDTRQCAPPGIYCSLPALHAEMAKGPGPAGAVVA